VALNLGELNAVIDADDRGFNRTIDRVHRKMEGTSVRMGSLSGLLGVLGKTTAFSAMATGIAGTTSSLGPLITLAGTLVATMGGLAGAAVAFGAAGAAVIGTLTIAFQGMGDAIAGDEEALERLPGPARDFAKAVSGLKDEWDDLRKSVQSKFFEDLTDSFETTAKNVLPHLKKGLTGVADGLSDIAAQALDAADSPEFLDGMNAVLKATEDGLKTASAGVGGFVRGMGTVMEVFAPLIERVGAGFASLGERFEAWINRARDTGQLQQLIDTMIDTLSTLAGIVGNVGSVFGSVFSAANDQGGGLLGTIENLTGKISDFLNSAEGNDALNSFFSALSDVADDVIPIVLELADAFATDLAPHIADIANEVGPSLRDLVREIGDAIGQVDVKELASGFADVLDAVIPLVDPLGDLLGGISSIEGLVPAIVIALGLWTVAQWALNAAMIANPIGIIIMLVAALIAAIVLIVIHWDEVVAAIKDRWNLLVDIWTYGKETVTALWTAMVDSVKAQIDQWIQGIHRIAQIPGMVLAWLIDMKDRAIAKFQEFVSNTNAKIDGILSAIQRMGGIPGQIAGFIQSAKDSAISKFTSLVDWVKGLPERIKDALGNLGSLLKNAGRDIINGLLDGIQEKFGAVQDKLSDLTNMLPDWKGPEAVDKKLLVKPGQWVIGGFIEGLESMIPQVERTLRGLTTDIGLSVDGAAAPSAPVFVVDVGDINLSQDVQVELDGQVLDARIIGTVNEQNRQTRRRVLAGTGAAR
jgi:phage-related protein